MSSVRYGTRLGDLKNKQPTESRHFGARGMSSVRYGTRLGDLKNKQSTERVSCLRGYAVVKIACSGSLVKIAYSARSKCVQKTGRSA